MLYTQTYIVQAPPHIQWKTTKDVHPISGMTVQSTVLSDLYLKVSAQNGGQIEKSHTVRSQNMVDCFVLPQQPVHSVNYSFRSFSSLNGQCHHPTTTSTASSENEDSFKVLE